MTTATAINVVESVTGHKFVYRQNAYDDDGDDSGSAAHYDDANNRDRFVSRIFRTKMLREKRRRDRRAKPYDISSRRMVRFNAPSPSPTRDDDDDYYDMDDFEPERPPLATDRRRNSNSSSRRRWCSIITAICVGVTAAVIITVSIVVATTTNNHHHQQSSTTSKRCAAYPTTLTSSVDGGRNNDELCSAYYHDQRSMYDLLFQLRDILLSSQRVIVHDNDDLLLVQRTLNVTNYLVTTRLFCGAIQPQVVLPEGEW